MINLKYLYSDITEKIIGCAFKVHSKMGNGFQEEIYQRCLEIEMEKSGLTIEREVIIPVFYENIKVGSRRSDFVVEGKVIVETKAVKKMDNAEWAQIINYLEAFNYEVGLAINFGNTSLEFKRFINNKKKSKSKNQ
jgi:GxxExxY protein